MNGGLLVLRDVRAWFMGKPAGYYELEKGFFADAKTIHANQMNVYFTNKGERCYVDRRAVMVFVRKEDLIATHR